MTTLIPFIPSPTAPFQFRATLDGGSYNGVVTWNTFGQRWYLNLSTVNGTRVLTIPLVGSPSPRALAAPVPPALPLAALAWSGGIVTATTVAPHGFVIGSSTYLTIAGVQPEQYVGEFSCTATAPSAFTYLVQDDPGAETIPGTYQLTVPAEALRWDAGVVTGYTVARLPYPVGTKVMLTISGAAPAAQNGRFLCTIETPKTFTYLLPTDPHLDAPLGSVSNTNSGSYSRDVSLTDGYFSSTLVWRPASGMIEVNP